MIKSIKDRLFVLDTKHTTYAFRVLPTGQLEHLYYGAKITTLDSGDGEAAGLAERHAFSPGTSSNYNDEEKRYTLDDMRLEYSAPGKGDLREPAVVVRHADGARTSDFVFRKAEMRTGTVELAGMPTAYDPGEGVPASRCSGAGKGAGQNSEMGTETAGDRQSADVKAQRPIGIVRDAVGSLADDEPHGIKAQTLTITMYDVAYNLELKLNYTVYPACDIITRSAVLKNCSEATVSVERLMSLCLDFDAEPYIMSTFNGAWAREMRRTDSPLAAGKLVNATTSGISSNRANPFVMLSKPYTTEDHGEVYAFNLVYSGNHYEAAEVSPFGKLRFVSGINPEGFCWQLAPGAEFAAPEAVMTYSDAGFNGMSQSMHAFVRQHIVRGKWKNRPRPVLLNSWEASYFNIDEGKLLKLAKAGRDAGIELFVMDDGWFGDRSDDTKALGDWDVNRKKLPHGIEGLAEKINRLGLDFGIWVEPEMISVNSDLYRAHPDWALQIPKHAHSEGRNQRFLDLTRTDVQDFIIEKMSRIFGIKGVSYVKWDMNRCMTDVFSTSLPPEQQGEVGHRYILGLYRVMSTLTKRFPDILFEGCASGGNRFDLGILSYFPQIWASDDSDAVARTEIQTGYSYGYPMSTVAAHVSDVPNHQTLRRTPLMTRFNVAAFGVLGYECNLCDMKKGETEAIARQIAMYKEWRDTFFFGSFYRGRSFGQTGAAGAGLPGGFSVLSPTPGNVTEWTVVSPDGSRAAGMLFQLLVRPNVQTEIYHARGLRPDQKYSFKNIVMKYNIKEFGSLVNAVAPIHVKPDGVIHNILAKKVKMDGETEDVAMYGDALMRAGVHVAQAFSGTGYSGEVRHMPDFASRLYFMEAVSGQVFG
ncbi:MAG: alpha-galactosidase [Eubacterium sp.]|nr:alpha-galactosidase [Eubacterium sp.]